VIDIHHHLLYGLDDGPADREAAIALAEAAIDDGITHVVCTPHANTKYKFNPQINRERAADIKAAVGNRLHIGLGCDFHLSFENIEQCLIEPSRYTINGGGYLLVEFSDFGPPPNISEIFFQLMVKGVRPIITHPERNPVFQSKPEGLTNWLRIGCLMQVTAGSLAGRFGNRAEKTAWKMLEKNWVQFVATDAHSVERRPPCLSGAWRAIDSRFGRKVADRLCIENPRAAFENQELGPQPEPEGIHVLPEEAKKPGLLARLFGRR